MEPSLPKIGTVPALAGIHRQGFSLVELSIVLVILGLLTGGILAGQSLIRASELRAATSEYQRIRTAIATFRDKYMALPGDMTNATKFWISAGGNGQDAACFSIGNSGTATCNGDGDGAIFNNTDTNDIHESFHAWQHLANAGLIEGQYTGLNGGAAWNTSPPISIPGTNVLASRLANSGYSIVNYGNYAGSVTWFPGNYGNFMFFGGALTTNYTLGSILTPQEAWSYDSKVDDGRPGYGNVMTFRSGAGTSTGCVTTTSESTAEYQTLEPSKNCMLVLKLGL